jgi:hypothetical protein
MTGPIASPRSSRHGSETQTLNPTQRAVREKAIANRSVGRSPAPGLGRAANHPAGLDEVAARSGRTALDGRCRGSLYFDVTMVIVGRIRSVSGEQSDPPRATPSTIVFRPGHPNDLVAVLLRTLAEERDWLVLGLMTQPIADLVVDMPLHRCRV